MAQQITVKQIEKPIEKELHRDVSWVCESLGLTSGRDIDHVSAQIIAHLLQIYPEQRRVSTELLADDLLMSAARINHHIRNFMESGFLYRQNRFIFLRGGSLKSAIEELRKDANRMFDELVEIAEDVDDTVGLKNR